MEQEETDCLTRLARTCQTDQNIVEIGNFRGCSTLALAAGAGPGVMIYSIDPHPEGPCPLFNEAYYSPLDKTILYQRMIDHGFLHKVSLIELSSREVDPDLLPHPFGLVFVDGDHSYLEASEDALEYGFHLIPGGFLAMHDRNDVGPKQVIEELVAGGGYEVTEEVVRLAVLRKVG
jgi:predicted O-methyltransferase YrrM